MNSSSEQLRQSPSARRSITRLSIDLEKRIECVELELIASILASPLDSFEFARSLGIDAAVFRREEIALCWNSIDTLRRLGRLRGEMAEDRDSVCRLICQGHREIYPGTWIPGTFGSVWTPQQRWLHLLSSAWRSAPLVATLFDAYPPNTVCIRKFAAELIGLRQQRADALSHFRYAVELLEADPLESFSPDPILPFSHTTAEREVA